jgi:hypothetical protein
MWNIEEQGLIHEDKYGGSDKNLQVFLVSLLHISLIWCSYKK